jgi:hypothetical protein
MVELTTMDIANGGQGRFGLAGSGGEAPSPPTSPPLPQAPTQPSPTQPTHSETPNNDDAPFDAEAEAAALRLELERLLALEQHRKAFVAKEMGNATKAGSVSDQHIFVTPPRFASMESSLFNIDDPPEFRYSLRCVAQPSVCGLRPRPEARLLRRLQRPHHFVNLHLPCYEEILTENGYLAGPPCAVCDGDDDGCHFTSFLSMKYNTAFVVNEQGVDEPVHSAYSQCRLCNAKYYHASFAFLSKCPLPLQRCYAADPEYATGELHFCRELTRGWSAQLRARSGHSTIATELEVRAARVCTDAISLYNHNGQVWWSQRLYLSKYWSDLPPSDRRLLVPAYAEYLYYAQAPDKLDVVDVEEDRTSVASVCLRTILSDLVVEKWLQAFQLAEAHRRLVHFSSTIAYRSISIDFSKRPGMKIGSSWMVTITQESYALMVGLGVGGTGIDQITQVLKDLRPRTGPQLVEVEAREISRLPQNTGPIAVGEKLSVVVDFQSVAAVVEALDLDSDWFQVMTVGAQITFLDNVPHKEHEKLEAAPSSYIGKVKEASQIPRHAQDRFHVVHNATQSFNQFDPRYREWAIVNLRNAAFKRRRNPESTVDDLLRRGCVQLNRTVWKKSVVFKLGETTSDVQLQALKKSGVYHELFGAGDTILVPEDLRSKDDLERCLALYEQNLERQVGVPHEGTGSYLITRGELKRLMPLLADRLENCRLPDGYDSWYGVPGRHLFTAPIYNQSGGTQTNENKHGASVEYMAADSAGAPLSTALMLNGHVPGNMKARRTRKLDKDVGHFDDGAIIAANRLATGDGERLNKLTAIGPYSHKEPVLTSAGFFDTFAKADSFDKRAARQKLVILKANGFGDWKGDARAAPPDYLSLAPRPSVSLELRNKAPSIFPPPALPRRQIQQATFSTGTTMCSWSGTARKDTSKCNYICNCLSAWPPLGSGKPPHAQDCDRMRWKSSPSPLSQEPPVGHVAKMFSSARGVRKDAKYLGNLESCHTWQEL